jgi:hypothetical protein
MKKVHESKKSNFCCSKKRFGGNIYIKTERKSGIIKAK